MQLKFSKCIISRWVKTSSGNSNFHKQLLGKAGEELAARRLEQLGWFIEMRNWRAGRYAELDIIARDASGLRVFIEVKTRVFIQPEVGFVLAGFDTINRRKQQKIITSAMLYLEHKGICDEPYRFDVIVIHCPDLKKTSLNSKSTEPEIIHVKGAFP